MTPPWKSRPALCVFLLVCLSYLAWLGTRGLNEPDEGRYSEISREMALQSDWLVPHLNGVPHFQKPPLIYWFTACSIKVFGANEWAVRLPSALAAAGVVGLTMLMAGMLFGTRCRWMTGLILLASAQFFVIARLITTDMLLTFWITASIYGLVVRMHEGRLSGLVIFYLAMGLGFLTKGPVVMIAPGFAATAWYWCRRVKSGVGVAGAPRLYVLIGFPLVLLIGLSWYLILINDYPDLYEYFVGYELKERIAGTAHKRTEPWWFYPSILLGGFVPWCVMMPDILRRAWKKLSAGDERAFLLLGWLLGPFVILSFVSSKLPTYMLPLFPPLAILIARWWDGTMGSLTWKCHVRVALGLFSLILAAIPFVIRHYEVDQGVLATRQPLLEVWIPSVLVLMVALAFKLSKPSVAPWVLPVVTGAMVSIYALVARQADDMMNGGNATMRDLAAYIEERSNPVDPPIVFMCDIRNNGMEFYLGRFVYRTVIASDIVLPLTREQDDRIVHDIGLFLKALRHRPSFIVAKTMRHDIDPQLADWKVVARSGSCLLLWKDKE